MSSDGKKKGGNFFGNIANDLTEPFVRKKGNFFENVFEGVVNLGLQTATGTTVGYQDGKIVAGAQGEGIINGLKTVTGAKAAEEANAIARKNFEDAQAAAEAQRLEQINQVGRDQLRQSRDAASARASAASRANARTGTPGATSALGSERDFLGL